MRIAAFISGTVGGTVPLLRGALLLCACSGTCSPAEQPLRFKEPTLWVAHPEVAFEPRQKDAATMTAGTGAISLRQGGGAPASFVLENEALAFTLTLDGTHVAHRWVRNQLADEQVELPGEDFAMELEPGPSRTAVSPSALERDLLAIPP